MIESRLIDEVQVDLDVARREFSLNALLDPTPEFLEKGWDLYARIAGLEDERDKVDSANSPRLPKPRPTLPDLVELRQKLRGEQHDISAVERAKFVFLLRVKGTQIGIGVPSMLAGLKYLEKIRAAEFCGNMLASR